MKLLKKNKKKGFTLIELVAVVAIIGILAALLVPKIAEYIQDAKKTKVLDQARKVVQAVETANTKNDVKIVGGTKVIDIKQVASPTGVNKTKSDAFKYLTDGAASGVTLADVLPNIDTTSTSNITIDDCKNVASNGTFKINDSGVLVDRTSIATS